MPCFALGTVATGFLKSTVFLSALTSVLVGLSAFFSDFFSAFFSGLAMLKTEVKVGALKGSVGAHKIKFGDWQGVTSAKTRFAELARVFFLPPQSTSTGNVGIGGKL